MFIKIMTGILTTGFCASLLTSNLINETNTIEATEPIQQVQTTPVPVVQEDCPYGNIDCPNNGNHENCQSLSPNWNCPNNHENCTTLEQHQNYQNCVVNSSYHHNGTAQRRSGHHGGRHHN